MSAAPTVILANGTFPAHPAPLALLRGAARVVCCDGAAAKLAAVGLSPALVAGDLDSLSPAVRRRFADRLAPDAGQADNDLAKAFRACLARGWRDIVILGATGLREDHTLGNIAWLADFARDARVRMVTDHGVFLPVPESVPIPCAAGQPVSVFSFDPAARLYSTGLKYPLKGLRLTRWWQATLNEAEGESFTLRFTGGPVLAYLCHMDRRGAGSAGAVAARQAVALTIAGSDSGGNAGIQADLRAFHGFGVHGCTAIAALTAQNPFGVTGIRESGARFLALQLDAILSAYAVGAAKTGMLASRPLIEAAADRLAKRRGLPLVADPVMVATSGARLLEKRAESALVKRLLPLATLITPNRPELETLTGRRARTRAAAAAAGLELAMRFGCAVLVKGGHAAARRGEDLLCAAGRVTAFTTPVVSRPLSTHGTGCALSAAITAALALGLPLEEAVAAGKAYVYEAILGGRRVGPRAAVLGMPGRPAAEWVKREIL